jgi:xanthosine phosphorylase
MGQIADSIENPVAINYADIPDFPRSSVSGHAGQLVLGTLQGVEVACFQGRVHMYEGVDPQALRIPTYALKLIGCDTLLLTTAVGSTRMESGPGSLVAITDHINLQARNPLIGPNDPIGDRFPSLLDAYDPELRAKLHEAASESDVTLRDGVYLANLGPSFETPAEIRAASVLGADVVGMSTVSEVICARHCGMKVAAIAVVVNYAAGLGDGHITHDETLHFTGQAADNVQSVVDSWIKKL